MKNDLLLEIGTEEMPAGWLDETTTQLKDKICNSLSAEGITYDNDEIFYTPRRIAVFIRGVATEQKNKYIEITGPPKELALTKGGNWTQAAVEFARAHSISTKELKLKTKGKKEVIYCEKLVKGKRTIEVLKSNLPQFIAGIEFTKSMKWEASGFRFGRPIRWIVALFGKSVIPFEIAGVKSGRKSQGLRGNPPIIIKEPSHYEKLLEANGIIANPTKRSNFILENIHKIRKDKGPPDMDKILTEVSNLVECPQVILCKFDEKYLALPDDVIITAMRAHQRYFELKNQDMSLSPYFIVVANIKNGDIDAIRKGHERVIRARLEDAEFYYKEDMKIRLEDRVVELKGITWQDGLGTLYDKTQRLIQLSKYIAEKYIPYVNLVNFDILEKAATLCKVDLLTNMIKDGKEFTTLEGSYGSILAEKQGLEEKIVSTIKWHSDFVFPRLPQQPEAVALALADRIDTIVGAFILDKIPTGSKDPLGIRRIGNEFVSVIIKNSHLGAGYPYLEEYDIHIPLKGLIIKVLGAYKEVAFSKREVQPNEIFEFIIQRFRKYLEDKEEISSNIIDAVIDTSNDDLVDLHKRVNALNGLKGKKDFITLVRLAKRVRNILNKAQPISLNPQLLKEPEEKELYNVLAKRQDEFKNYIDKKDYVRVLNWLLNLAPLINNFFDKVLVMAPEPAIRENRIALLQYLYSFFAKVADFSKLLG